MELGGDEDGQGLERRGSGSRDFERIGPKAYCATRIFIETVGLLAGAITSVGTSADHG